MELKDFIKNSITAISEGIIEAQLELKDKNVIINPEKLGTGKTGEKLLLSDGWRYTQELEFEILVNTEESNTLAGGGKLTILKVVSVGIDSKSDKDFSNSNKLKFKIPVALPTTQTPDNYKPKSASGSYSFGS